MPEELTRLSASALAALVRARRVSAVEVAEAHLCEVGRRNPRLNAVVTLAPDVTERAREVDAALARGGECGALAGVPVTVKDTIEVAGLRTTFGSRVFAEYVPDVDAPSVARLRAAGAIILGKTNASELALDYTADNPVFGRTNNPLDVRLTPGGSSGGCAAAVASCMTAAGLGSDLAGSLRVPAHFCGVASLRPTAGRVPGGGHLPPVEGPFALGASLGPIARRVEDLELLFDVLSGEGARDESSARTSEEIVDSLRGRRFAFYSDDGHTPVTDETRLAVESAARALEDAGMVGVEETPPHVGRATKLWGRMFSRATQEFLIKLFAGREDEAGPLARLLIERGRRSGPPAPDEYGETLRERERLRGELVGWMDARPVLVAPVGAVPAYEHDTRVVSPEGGKPFGVFAAFGYALAFSALDLPAACVRAGWTHDGLPVGVQVVGRPRAEREVLAAARAVELTLRGERRAR